MTRDAYYKAKARERDNALDCLSVLKIVIREKAILKHSGAKKIFHMLKDEIKEMGIKMGRDKFFTLLKDNGLTCKKNKYKKPKTDSKHPFMKYSNLIKDLDILRVNQVWVSDITYIRVDNKWSYLTLITDLYSRKIVGYSFAKGMTVEETTAPAIKKALKFKKDSDETILHSDRGVQYCMPKFTDKVKKKGITFSNTQGGDPYENAVAERLNGILKYEFELKDNFKNFKLAKNEIDKAIVLYNAKRPHWSLDLKTPDEVFFENSSSQKPLAIPSST
jgi:transposase InsO family protein